MACNLNIDTGDFFFADYFFDGFVRTGVQIESIMQKDR